MPALNFQQQVDVTRPHTLLTDLPKRKFQLMYRYDDTGEEVVVPNIWYNQCYDLRVESFKERIKEWEVIVHTYETTPPINLSKWQVQNIIDRHKNNIFIYKSKILSMQKEGNHKYPVKATVA